MKKNLILVIVGVLVVALVAGAVLLGIFGGRGEDPTTAPSTQGTGPAPTNNSTGTTGPVHTHDYTQRDAEPSCTQGGYTVFTCACGDTYKEETVAALGHDFGEWETVKPATEEAEGLRQRKCKRCDVTEEEVLPKLDATHTHDYTEKVVEPTCTEEGYTYFTCACGDSYKENTVAALGHAWSEWETVSKSSCTTSGSKSRACSACGLSQTEAVPATGHHYGAWTVVTEPTCEETGMERSRCSVCAVEDTRSIAALGHDYEEKTEAPTCTKTGSKTETCKRCGKTTRTTLPPVDHSWSEWMPRSAANCTEGGEEYRNCASCGEKETRTVAPGHSWGEWEVTKPATRTEPGIRERTCRACGAKETMEAFRDKDGHSHDWVNTTVDATCEEAGYIWQTCSYCGYERRKPGSSFNSTNGSNSEGHGWSEWVTTKEPTTESPGEEQRTCRYCGEIQVAILPMLSEDGSSYESYIDPAIEIEQTWIGGELVTRYFYKDIMIRDYRTWGEPISIWVNEDDSVTVQYHNIAGELVEATVGQPPDGYSVLFGIKDDGTHYINTIGQPG